MKDTLSKKSLFTKIKEAIDIKDYETVSRLQIELKNNMDKIQQLYLILEKYNIKSKYLSINLKSNKILQNCQY